MLATRPARWARLSHLSLFPLSEAGSQITWSQGASEPEFLATEHRDARLTCFFADYSLAKRSPGL